MCSMGRILHADLDAFYASVEQRDNPRLRGQPVIVGGGVVLAASYEARRLGVRTAMGGRQALSLCPQAVVVPPRMAAYSEASRRVFEIFGDISPEVEGLSIDEAFIDVTGLRRLAGTDLDIARRLQKRVAAEVGLPLSVGGGSTKFLAKVASAVSKPNGVLVVPDGGELTFLHPLPVRRLWGVGPVTQERLAAIGVRTVGDLAELERIQLETHLGRAGGRHVWALARNLDPRPVETGRRRRSVGSQHSFRAGTVGRAGTEEILLGVVDRVASRLRAGHRVARTVILRLRFADFASATRSRTLSEATDVTAPILGTARQLLDEAWPLIEERGLTKVGVAVTGLSAEGGLQLALPFTKAKPVALDAAVDQIRNRFGSTSLVRTALVGREAVEMPRLPD
jgi:DNA polymerase IV